MLHWPCQIQASASIYLIQIVVFLYCGDLCSKLRAHFSMTLQKFLGSICTFFSHIKTCYELNVKIACSCWILLWSRYEHHQIWFMAASYTLNTFCSLLYISGHYKPCVNSLCLYLVKRDFKSIVFCYIVEDFLVNNYNFRNQNRRS